MSRVSDYAFINAKLRARIGRMHQSGIFEQMVKARSLAEAVALLRDTRHSEIVKVYDRTGDFEQIELSLLEEEIREHRDVEGWLKTERSRAFIRVITEKVEIENLKNALRLWYASVMRNRPIGFRAGYIYKEDIVNPVNWNGIINAPDLEHIKESLTETPYLEAFDGISEDEIRENGLFSLEIRLDHIWFDRVFRAIDGLKGEDRKVALEVYSSDVDIKNILLFTRYFFYHHLSGDALESVIIRHGAIWKELEEKEVFSMKEPGDAIRNIIKKRYRNIWKDFGEKDEDDGGSRSQNEETVREIVRKETWLAETRKREFSDILRKDPFTIGVSLAYLFLFKDEDRMIRSILSAHWYGWDEERIREAII